MLLVATGVRAATDYEVIDVQLQDGDYVVFCSDAIAEAENEAGEQFGYESTEETTLQACLDGLWRVAFSLSKTPRAQHLNNAYKCLPKIIC